MVDAAIILAIVLGSLLLGKMAAPVPPARPRPAWQANWQVRLECVEQERFRKRSDHYLSGGRLAAIFTTCVWSSVSQASTPIASASDRPSLTAASCVGEMACGALGTTLISCSRTAVACETRTSPGFTFDNDSGGFSFDTASVWADLAIRAVPFST